MDITRKDVNSLNAILKVNVKPEDYQGRVEKVLKDHRKTAKMSGFRQGMVPMGLIKKMYGTSVLADELNKVVNESLYDYIKENDIQILGNPLPKDGNEKANDLDKQDDFEFEYELGLSPEVSIKSTEGHKFNYYKIIPDADLISKQINDLAKRYGQVSQADAAEESDMIQGEFTELDEKGEIKAGGIFHTSTVALEYMEDAKVKKQFIGAKPGDIIKVNPEKISRGLTDMAAMLGIEKAQAEQLKSDFNFKALIVYRMAPAELNQELFDKLFGPGVVSSEEEFRSKVSGELEKSLSVESEKKLKMDISEKLLDKLKLSLPDEFLKRWLLAANENKLTQEQVDAEYDDYSKGLKWQLIENKIIKEKDLKVEPEEAVDFAKEMIGQQLAAYGQSDISEQQLNETAQKLLSNQEEGKKIYEQLFDKKLTEHFKNSFKLTEKEVTYDEFVKLVSGKKSKFNLLNSLKF